MKLVTGVLKLLDSTPKTIKDHLISKCANILATYRQHCCTNPNAGQLILPECMKLLPLYINCLLKSDAISGGPDMTIDDKSYVMQALTIMPVSISVGFLYPRLLALHDVNVQDVDLPPRLRCSFERFAEDGAYLLGKFMMFFTWKNKFIINFYRKQHTHVLMVGTCTFFPMVTSSFWCPFSQGY